MIQGFIYASIYVLGFAFSYWTLTNDKHPEAKAYLLSIFWLPIMIVRIVMFVFIVSFPKWYNDLRTFFKSLMW